MWACMGMEHLVLKFATRDDHEMGAVLGYGREECDYTQSELVFSPLKDCLYMSLKTMNGEAICGFAGAVTTKT